MQPRRKRLALVALVVAASVVAIVSVGVNATASPAAAHDHASPAANVQDELAQVRQATARFHRVEEATAAGYELGWVNGSNVRILTGCVADPTAGAMGYHYINPALMADNTVD